MDPLIDGTELAPLLKGLGSLDVLRLPQLGWLQVKTLPAYLGRHPVSMDLEQVPAKRSVFFTSNWESETQREFASESERFLAFLHPDGDVEGEEPFVVVRSAAGDAVAAAVVTRLREHESCDVLNFGTFTRFEKAGVRRLRFAPATDLEALLNAARGQGSFHIPR